MKRMTAKQWAVGAGKRSAGKRVRVEDEVQRACVKMLRLHPWIVFCAVPNGGARSKTEAAIMIGLGTVAGAPDLLIFNETRCGSKMLAVEFKRPGEKPEPEQVEFATRLRAVGVRAEVIDSVDAFHALFRECFG